MESEAIDAHPEVPWQRVRPISLIFVIVAKLRQWIVPIFVGLYSAQQGRLFVIGLGVLAFSILLTFSLIRYFTLQFRLAGGELQVREGVIFRSSRTVPVNRIQNIDLVQNVLHRLFGVAEVRIETASGKEPEAILRVLSLADVEELRARVFAQATSAASLSSSQAVTATATADEVLNGAEDHIVAPPIVGATPIAERPQRTLLAISLKQLALAGICSDRGLLLVPITLGALYEMRNLPGFSSFKILSRDQFRVRSEDIAKFLPQGLGTVYVVAGLLLGCMLLYMLLKVFSIAWYVIRFYGYQLRAIGDDLRIECGLLTRVSATVPKSRIQFISIHRGWLGRRLGMATIRIETAGGGGTENENASQSVARRWFVPVLYESQVPEVIEQLRPGIEWRETQFDWRPLSPRAGARMRRFAIVSGVLLTLVAAIVWRPWGAAVGLILFPSFLWAAAKTANAMRYARTDSLVLFRSGLLTRKVSFAFADKIQAIGIKQSPFDRRWRMATLSVDTAAAGPAEHRIQVRFMDASEAQHEFAELKQFSTV